MTTWSLLRRRVVTGCGLSAIAVLYAAFPPRPRTALLDQQAFADTVARMRAGAGYYDATARAFAARDTALGSVGGFRMPTPFVVWRWIPADALYPSFVLVVVLVTTWTMLWMTRHPVVVAPVTVYLLWVSYGEFESWLHPEWWALPLVAAALLAHERNHPGLAATFAAGACVFRELAFLLVLGGLVDAWRHRRAVVAWLVAAGTVLSAFAAHALVASDHLAAQSGEMGRLGTGDPPRTVLTMAGFRLPLLVGLVVWSLAFLALRRRGELLVAAPLALLPLAGIVVNRPYWGILLTPLFLLWSFDFVAASWSERVRPTPPAGARPP